MKTIYLTYCTWDKDDQYRITGEKIAPNRLYQSRRIHSFVTTCKERYVEWAIFSDLYGVWFPDEQHEWYDKSPETVTKEEFIRLVDDFDRTLSEYQKIGFYVRHDTFHNLYKELVSQSRLVDRIEIFEDLSKVGTLS